MTDEYMAEGLSASERAELVLFGMERGSHRPGGEEKDLYAITKASLVRAIEAAERDARASAAATPAQERAYQAARDNLREAWAALAMIRETVETLAPSGSVKASEHLDGPTFMHEADALVAGIMAMVSRPNRGAGS